MNNKHIISLIILAIFSSSAISSEFIICNKGKIEVGDHYDKFIQYCGQPKNFSGGMTKLGKNGIVMSFKKIQQKYDDGSSASYIFLDDILAFI
ncbi:hypothetical protein EOL34_26190, partial [Enterobacter hormaechei]